MSKECICKSFGCGEKGGVFQSVKTWGRHLKADFAKSTKNINHYEPINEWDMDPNLSIYRTHWTAKSRYNSKLSVLEYLFQTLKIFASKPNESKDNTSTHLYHEKYDLSEVINEKLPNTFEEAISILSPFLMPLKVYNVCTNDCVIFWRQYKDDTNCPVCGESRYEDDGRTARRHFTYYPLTPRIRRWVATENICNMLTAHKYAHHSDPNIQRDIQDSYIWREEWFGEGGLFSDVDIGIPLSVCLDGVNPFDQLRTSYSMWPIEVLVNSFPPALRKSSVGIMNAGITIPGNGTQDPEIDAY